MENQPKTQQRTRKMHLGFFAAALMALMAGGSKNAVPSHPAPNGFLGGGSPVHLPRRGKLKGWQKENRRYRQYANR